MTAISGGFIEHPPALAWGAAAPAFGNNRTIDATAEKAGMVFQVPKTGTIDAVGFLLGTVTQAPTNGLKVSLQDPSTTGLPDGTPDQYRVVPVGSISTGAWITTGLITSDGTDGGAKRSVTRGDVLCVVIEFSSFVAGDNLNIQERTGGLNDGAMPYVVADTGAWAKSTNTGDPVVALKYDDGLYYPAPRCYPMSALTTLAVNTGTTPDEIGLKFRVPVGIKVGGLWIRRSQTAARDVTYKLYDSDGSTVLKSFVDDGDFGSGNNRYLLFSSEVTLVANTYYRLTALPSSASSLNFYYFDVAAAGIMDAIPGGQDMHWTQRTDAGAWTDTTTRRPWMGLLITDITSGSGGMSRARVANQGGGLL